MAFQSVLCSLLFLSLPLAAFSCDCKEERITVENSLKVVDAAFRGFVVRKLRNIDDDLNQLVYIVQVQKVYKGCNFNASEQILVTTGSNSAICGINIQVFGTYAFFGFDTPIDPKTKEQIEDTAIKRAVYVRQCYFNRRWSTILRANVRRLRNYDNSGCVVTCTTGADCNSTEYCDDGTCFPYKETTCSNPVNCFVAPCNVTKPCTDRMLQCIDNYCGGCNAIFVDDTGTRVCKPS